MRSIFTTSILVALCALVLMACGPVKQQRGKINNARMAIAAGGEALGAADAIVADLYQDRPLEDTESYCRNKIASVIFTQFKIVLEAAADSVLLWEQALDTYLVRKDAKQSSTLEWGEVLSSEAEWFKVFEKVAAVLEDVRQTLMLWIPNKIPYWVNYAWKFVGGMAGKDVVDFEFDFSSLRESVCKDYLPGGG